MIDSDVVRELVRESMAFHINQRGECFTLPRLDERYIIGDEELNESIAALAGMGVIAIAGSIATSLAGIAATGWVAGKVMASTAAAAAPVAAPSTAAVAATSIKAAFASIGIVNPAVIIGVGAVGASLLIYGGYKYLTRQKPRKGVMSDVVAAHLVKAVNARDVIIKKYSGKGDPSMEAKLIKPTTEQTRLGVALEKAAKDDYLAKRIDSTELKQLNDIANLAKAGKLSYL